MRPTRRRLCGAAGMRADDAGPAARQVVLVGHPFAPIGMGEHIRCTFRALRCVGWKPGLMDLYGLNPPDAESQAELSPHLVEGTGTINVFHINGDEVEQALATLDYRPRVPRARNVVYPAWELPRYPRVWARQLERFDEIWAPSRFVAEAIKPQVACPVVTMPLACEVVLSEFRGRRWFGIPEADYAFLFFFDLRSYVARKNPQAVAAAFRAALRHRPGAHATLVLKVNGADIAPAVYDTLRESLADLRESIVWIDRTLTDNETKNLVRCCDCFVSLHRAEGFGRGLCEAMYLGKPVIGTAYSGNLEFMDRDNALLVDYRLVAVEEGQYPHWQDQLWAEPDVAQAASHMAALLDEPEFGRRLGRRAAHRVRRQLSYRAAGLRFVERLTPVAAPLAGVAGGATQREPFSSPPTASGGVPS